MSNLSAEELMRVAIDAARRGMAARQTPFGCAIARDGKVVAACHNTVWLTCDITAHAEINALREACRRRQDIHLDGAVVATTCEPCPMCAAALHWARVAEVHFGATIQDATNAGFNELAIPAAEIVARGNSPVILRAGCLPLECRQLFDEWKATTSAHAY